jgi:hypothetical protein
MSHRTLLLAVSMLLATCIGAPAPAAAAETPLDDARIDRLLDVTRARQMLEGMLPQVEASQRQMVAQLTAGQELDDAQRARMEAIVSRSSAAVRQALAWENLEPIYRDIYRRTFSAEDIDAIVAFYETPAGQRMIEKMPALMQHTMEAMQGLVVPMLEQMQREISAEVSAGG